MRVVGCAGSDEKAALVRELGAAECWNYRIETDPVTALQRVAPEGVDVFFDNVGGPILDAALKHMNKRGVILACGAISEYDSEAAPLRNWYAWSHRSQEHAQSSALAPHALAACSHRLCTPCRFYVTVNRLRIHGFIASDFFEGGQV